MAKQPYFMVNGKRTRAKLVVLVIPGVGTVTMTCGGLLYEAIDGNEHVTTRYTHDDLLPAVKTESA